MADIAIQRSSEEERKQADRDFAKGVARAFGGAIFFSLPLLMTMEMWWLGFYMDRVRLALITVLLFPLLVGLDHYSGFKETSSWGEDALDAAVALGVGVVASAVVLALFDVIEFAMPPREVVGKILLQAVPASFGAVLANSQMREQSGGQDGGGSGGQKEEERRKQQAGYGAELLFMTAGALFLAFNVAPTEEMILIAFKMSAWHALVLAAATLAMMHAFVFSIGLRGSHSAPEGTPGWSMFARFTLVGYAIALLVSAYVLWTFGRYEDTAAAMYVREAVVLGFPAGLGAAAARLIL